MRVTGADTTRIDPFAATKSRDLRQDFEAAVSRAV
jgi:hypothetical protein